MAFFFQRGLNGVRSPTVKYYTLSGLNLVVAAITLWNTVYLERAARVLRQQGQDIPDDLLARISPLKWEHINLTGDYHWRKDAGLQDAKLRPLRGHQAVAFP